MRSRKVTLGLLTKIPVEKLVWGMSTTRKEEEEKREAASGHPGKDSPALGSLICCPLSKRTLNSTSCMWRTSHWCFLRKDTQDCASRISTLIPKVDTGEVEEKFIMLKGKNTVCVWLEASTCHSKRTDDTDGKPDWEWVCVLQNCLLMAVSSFKNTCEA